MFLVCQAPILLRITHTQYDRWIVIKKDIENISLGPRQLLFDFEKDKSKEQAMVIACIENKIEKCGHVALDECVQYVKEANELSDAAIIQYIFWLAKDLKVHFRLDGEHLEPSELKRALLKSIERHVTIVPNKSVDNSIFQDVKRLYQQLSEEKGFNDCDDQYEFARFLLKKIKSWQVTLKACESDAQKPFPPYEEEIYDCMHFINEISAKLDSFSLINAFYNNQEAILKLSDDVRKISEFYFKHIEFWKNLVLSFEEVNNNLSELVQNPDIAASVKALKQILSAAAPDNRIPEAKKILNKMTQQCRISLLAKLDDMIVAMKIHLDTHGAGSDLRNKSLYFLRATKKRIHQANNIKNMNLCLIDAEEKFDAFWDEIEI